MTTVLSGATTVLFGTPFRSAFWGDDPSSGVAACTTLVRGPESENFPPHPEENVALTVIWKMENMAGSAVWRIVLKIHAETMHGSAPQSSSATLVPDNNFTSSDFGTEIHEIGVPFV